jgi:hypothetical protein
LLLEKQKPERLSASRCQLQPERLAVWWSDDLAARLSGLAAKTLAEAKLLDMSKLEPHRASRPPDEWRIPPNVDVHCLSPGPKEYDTRRPISDPISGGGVAIFNTITN